LQDIFNIFFLFCLILFYGFVAGRHEIKAEINDGFLS